MVYDLEGIGKMFLSTSCQETNQAINRDLERAKNYKREYGNNIKILSIENT